MLTETRPAWPWHSVPGEIASATENRLFSELGVGTVFILVDPIAGLDGLELLAELPQFPLNATALRLQQQHVPFLVALPDRHDARLLRSVHIAMQEQLKLYRHTRGVLKLGGWLQHIHHDGCALAAQLTRLFQLDYACMGVPWLRLADRRVMEMLHQGQQQSQPAQIPPMDWPRLLGENIPCWAYMDRNFTIRTLRGEPGQPSGRHLSIAPAYWQLLGRSIALSELLTRWHGRQHPLPENAMGQLLLMLRRVEQDHPDWTQARIVAHINARLAE